MFLIIPTIDLQEDYCVRKTNHVYERETVYFDDPAQMARLWRLQNAKTLNIVGHDPDGKCRLKILKSICDAVDIPVQLQSGLSSMDAVRTAFEAGVYRVVIDISNSDSTELFEEAHRKYGCSKIVAGLQTDGSKPGGSEPDHRSHISVENAIEHARRLEELGCRRFVFSDFSLEDRASEAGVSNIRKFGRSLKRAKVTVQNCVSNYADLKIVCELDDANVDSIILDRALYENAFPCQGFWSWNQKSQLDLSSVSTARLRDS